MPQVWLHTDSSWYLCCLPSILIWNSVSPSRPAQCVCFSLLFLLTKDGAAGAVLCRCFPHLILSHRYTNADHLKTNEICVSPLPLISRLCVFCTLCEFILPPGCDFCSLYLRPGALIRCFPFFYLRISFYELLLSGWVQGPSSDFVLLCQQLPTRPLAWHLFHAHISASHVLGLKTWASTVPDTSTSTCLPPNPPFLSYIFSSGLSVMSLLLFMPQTDHFSSPSRLFFLQFICKYLVWLSKHVKEFGHFQYAGPHWSRSFCPFAGSLQLSQGIFRF